MQIISLPVSGLCGNFDGNQQNDFLQSDGTLYEYPAGIADTGFANQPNNFSKSWRYSPILRLMKSGFVCVCVCVCVCKEGSKEMFYLTMHSRHFIYGYMASGIW